MIVVGSVIVTSEKSVYKYVWLQQLLYSADIYRLYS